VPATEGNPVVLRVATARCLRKGEKLDRPEGAKPGCSVKVARVG